MKKNITILTIALISLININSSQAQDAFLGEIRIFAGNYAPRGWAFCDGNLLPIAENTALFSILGTTYGGDGRTTFGLPNIQGRIVIGPGRGPGLSSIKLGEKLGTETNTLTSAQLPAHNHGLSVKVNTSKGEEVESTGILSSHDNAFSNEASTGQLGGVNTSTTGQNQPVNNMQPYIVVRYIIALTGTYPSRS